MASDARRAEIDRNFDFFQRHVSEFMRSHRGEYVLLKNQKPVGFFPSVSEADNAGRARFPDGVYSVQEVDDQPIDLGWFSRVAV